MNWWVVYDITRIIAAIALVVTAFVATESFMVWVLAAYVFIGVLISMERHRRDLA